MVISLRCPDCRAGFEVAHAEPGSTVSCPTCGAEVLLPETADPGRHSRPKDVARDSRSSRAPDPSDYRSKGKERRAAKFDDAPGSAPVPPEPPRGVKDSPPPADSPPPLPVPSPPATTLPVATALPAPAVPPVAARVAPADTPVLARPTTRVLSEPGTRPQRQPHSDDEDEPPRRGRFRHRSRAIEDDDDESPRPRREKPGGSKILVLVLGLVAVVALLGIAGAVYLGYRYLQGDSSAGSGPTLSTMPSRPPSTPNWEKGRSPLLQADGFTVHVPIGAGGGRRTLGIDWEQVSGHRYEVSEASINYRIEWYDLPAELGLSAGTFARKVREQGPPATLLSGPTRVTIGGTEGEELIYQGRTGQSETIRAAKLGPRVMIFAATFDPGSTASFPGLFPEEKLREFFDSVRFTYDQTTAPPPSLRKKETTKPKDQDSKPPAPSKSKLPRPPVFGSGAADGIKLLNRIDPFATAIYLPARKELLTFGGQGGGPPFGPGMFRPGMTGGAIRRYSVPEFKLLATRNLSRPVIHAAANEKTGRLFVATVNLGPSGFDAREQLRSVGDIQVYDLADVLAENEPKDGLQPRATYKADAKLTDLELSPDGQLLYTAVVVHPTMGKKPRVRLLRLKTADLTVSGELGLATPVLATRLSPDGKHLMALEHPFNAFGVAGFGGAATGEVLIVDAAGMKKVSSAAVSGLPSDLRFLDEQRAIAVVVGGIRPRLFSVTIAGEAMDVTAPDGLKASQAGFLAAAPAAGRLVTSARMLGMTGTEVFEAKLSGEPPKSLGSASVMPNAMFAGPVVLTPDGKYAVYGTGTVVELTAGDQ